MKRNPLPVSSLPLIVAMLLAFAAPQPGKALLNEYGQGGPWPHGAVPVCWLPAATGHPKFTTWSRWTLQVVQNGWARAADLRFTGWGTCPAETRGMVAIGFDNTRSDETSHIGYLPNATSFMNFNQGDADGKVQFQRDALHEFGHVLGFGHEMDRDGNPWVFPNGCWGTLRPGDTLGTPYDADSIMNYCSSGAALSPWDIVGVQNLYGRKHPGTLVGRDNFALDLPGGTSVLGAPLQVYTQHGGPNQRWSRVGGGALRTYVGTTIGVYRCADVPNGVSSAEGTVLRSEKCRSSETQRLLFQNVEWRGMGNKCVATRGATPAAGQVLELATCTGARSQKWTFSPKGLIRSGRSDLCLEVPGGVGTSGTLLSLAPCSSGVEQRFGTNALGEIRHGGLCLDSQSARPEDGRRIQLYPCKQSGRDKRNQQFHLSGAVHGYSGQCLDIRGGAARNGAKAQLYPSCTGAPNQRWDYYFR